jgi:hypothetical protein
MNFFMLRFFVNAIKANKSITLRSNDTVHRNVGNRMTGRTGGTDKRVTPAGKHNVVNVSWNKT